MSALPPEPGVGFCFSFLPSDNVTGVRVPLLPCTRLQWLRMVADNTKGFRGA